MIFITSLANLSFSIPDHISSFLFLFPLSLTHIHDFVLLAILIHNIFHFVKKEKSVSSTVYINISINSAECLSKIVTWEIYVSVSCLFIFTTILLQHYIYTFNVFDILVSSVSNIKHSFAFLNSSTLVTHACTAIRR